MQTSWIAGSIFVGFVVYVTIKGQLPQYQKAIFGGQQSSTAAPTGTAAIGSTAANPPEAALS